MSREEQQKRYMKLNGEPLHASFMRATLCSPMAKAAGLSVIFNLATITGGNAQNIAASLTASALTFTVVSGLTKGVDWFLKFKFDGHGDTLCIDTAPQSNTPETPPQYKQAAEDLRHQDAIALLPLGLVTALSSAINLAMATMPTNILTPHISLYLSTGGTLAACILGRTAHSFYRFGKVVEEDWVITDMPAPEKKEEKITATALKPV